MTFTLLNRSQTAVSVQRIARITVSPHHAGGWDPVEHAEPRKPIKTFRQSSPADPHQSKSYQLRSR